jgi:magnesium-protoporphyrin O-methyltransferase
MSGCCDPRAYGQVFNERAERHDAAAFRRHGLRGPARALVDAVIGRGVTGLTMLEIGGGAGGSAITLLEAGVAQATVFDLSPAAKRVAAELIAERGLTDRVTWHSGDFLDAVDRTASADLVFLNRVVCCYPDMPLLVDAARNKATRCLALSFPRRRLLARIGVGVINLFLRVRRNTFRVYVHDVAEITERVTAAGFTEVVSGRSPVWEWHVWERTWRGDRTADESNSPGKTDRSLGR